MLVTFSSSAHADITLFGDVAVRLLQLMGHSGTIPGAIVSEDIVKALQHLQAAIEEQQTTTEQYEEEDDDENDNEPPVSLAHRALPLIEMLQAAANANCNVMWEKSDPFDLIK